MPAFTTKFPNKNLASVPPVFLCFSEPVLQAEYQRFMPAFTTKFQNKMRLRSRTQRLCSRYSARAAKTVRVQQIQCMCNRTQRLRSRYRSPLYLCPASAAPCTLAKKSSMTVNPPLSVMMFARRALRRHRRELGPLIPDSRTDRLSD